MSARQQADRWQHSFITGHDDNNKDDSEESLVCVNRVLSYVLVAVVLLVPIVVRLSFGENLLFLGDGEQKPLFRKVHKDAAVDGDVHYPFDYDEDGSFDGGEIDCDTVPERIRNVGDASEINALRRRLMLHDPSCFARQLNLFAEVFRSRLKMKHLMLHIPKTGGTSVCNAVKKRSSLTHSNVNCWTQPTCPIWCCCEVSADAPKRWATCDEMSGWGLDFVMNENWLDEHVCGDQRTYSIILREPVARSASHLRHLESFFEEEELKKRSGVVASSSSSSASESLRRARVALGRSNYVTWALTAGVATRDGTTSNPTYFAPAPRHLRTAKERLLRMDYVLDLSYEEKDPKCVQRVVNFLGVQSLGGHANRSDRSPRDYEDKYGGAIITESRMTVLNLLDVQLYDFATTVMDADCEFFELATREDTHH